MNQATFAIVATLSATLLMGTGALAQDYDLVITGGRVMDPETLYDDIANVGITDGRIVEISKDTLTGADEIDVGGGTVKSRAYVGWFNFRGSDQQKPVKNLSGGIFGQWPR